jgi:3-oxoacyl-[acyl-carrier-protein] synthase II
MTLAGRCAGSRGESAGREQQAEALARLTRAARFDSMELDEVDPRCAPLDYVGKVPREARTSIVMSNNFAFGGINTSLILGKV